MTDALFDSSLLWVRLGQLDHALQNLMDALKTRRTHLVSPTTSDNSSERAQAQGAIASTLNEIGIL